MRLRRKISRVDMQVSILICTVVAVSCFIMFFFCYVLTYDDMINSLQERVLSISHYLNEAIDEAAFLELDEVADEQGELYAGLQRELNHIRRTTGVMYLYTAKQADDGRYIYLIDGLPLDSEDFRHVGDLIEPEIIPDIRRALAGEEVMPGDIKETSWGYIFISYMPVYAGDEVIGVVGIEFEAGHQYHTFLLIKILTPLVVIFTCLGACLVAVRVFKRISNPFYQDLANTDMLTGMKNRNAFETDMSNLARMGRMEGICILSYDLDYLKQVNDTLGHRRGDDYIRSGCKLFIQCMRGNYVPYRVGGDEFAAVAMDMDEATVRSIMMEIDEKMAAFAAEDRDLGESPSLSAGYAFYDRNLDKSLFDTMERADEAMYENKKKKRPRTVRNDGNRNDGIFKKR